MLHRGLVCTLVSAFLRTSYTDVSSAETLLAQLVEPEAMTTTRIRSPSGIYCIISCRSALAAPPLLSRSLPVIYTIKVRAAFPACAQNVHRQMERVAQRAMNVFLSMGCLLHRKMQPG